MSYVLIPKEQLTEKGLFPFAEVLPDGRAVLPFRALKSLSGVVGVDIVDADTVKKLMKLENTTTEKVETDVEGTDQELIIPEDTEIIPSESQLNDKEEENAEC